MKCLTTLLSLSLSACGLPFEIERPAAVASNAAAQPASNVAKIIVLDVGQGDAALVIEPEGKAALIDTGGPRRGADAIQTVLEEHRVTEVPYIFISHHHEDHEGSLAELLEQNTFAETEIIEPETAAVGERLDLGPVQIEILGANGQIGNQMFEAEDENAKSIALRIRLGAFTYLTAGDLPGGGGEPPYQTIDLETALGERVGDIDVLHVNHHGSNTGTNQNLLDLTTPEIAVISVGDQNDFFHPHPSVTNRLLTAGIQVFQTERGWLTDAEAEPIEIAQGHICILTNGQTTTVEPYAEKRCRADD